MSWFNAYLDSYKAILEEDTRDYEIASLKSQVKSLKSRLSKQKNCTSGYKEFCESLKAELSAALKDNDKLRTERDSVAARVDIASEREVHVLKASIMRTEADINAQTILLKALHEHGGKIVLEHFDHKTRCVKATVIGSDTLRDELKISKTSISPLAAVHCITSNLQSRGILDTEKGILLQCNEENHQNSN